jgi:hypothetical protein
MKVLWIALLLCAGFILALAFMVPGDTRVTDRAAISPVMGNLPGVRQVNITGTAFPAENGTGQEGKTAIFSKYVAASTPYIVVSLYSGDPSDPLSVTIITPDKTLGPYSDASDGKTDGRIDLKITSPETVTPGYWKFLVHSRKEITYGSLDNLSWIRTGT